MASSVFILTKKDKFSLIILSFFQFINSVIEVISLSLIGVFSILMTARITSQEVNLKSQTFFSQINQQTPNNLNALILLAVTAILLFLLKTLIGIYLFKSLNVHLGRITTRISLEKLEAIAAVKYSWISKQKSAEFSYYLGQGINSDFNGKLLGSYIILAETIFVTTVTIFLFILNPLLTLVLAALLLIFFLVIANFVVKPSKVLHEREVSFLMKNQQFSLELFRSFKELIISNYISVYQDRMKDSRVSANSIRGKIQWLEQLPKFVLEFCVLIFGIVIILVSALPSDAIKGATSLVIFSVALTRLMPSFLRLQAALVLYQACRYRVASASNFFLSLAENASEKPTLQNLDIHSGLPTIEFHNIDFGYVAGQKIIDNFSCRFEPGKVNCIVGPSGVGKSTVLELALGLMEPSHGKIFVGNVHPRVWRAANPNSAYYLPQESSTLEASIYENIVMKKPSSNPIEYDSILNILEKVGLKDVVERHRKGLLAILGTDVKLSGGERQRLGIARALFKETKLLILDEPTSSLDDKAEEEIFKILRDISEQCTLILVTHSSKALKFFPESLTALSLRGS